MKREVSPVVVGVVIAVVVIVLGFVFYRQATVNPPSAHPQLHFSASGVPAAPGSATTPGSH